MAMQKSLISARLRALMASILIAIGSVTPTQAQDVLPPDVAFQYVAADAGGVIEIDWALEDGYYLYKNQLSFASNSDSIILGDYALPDGLDHEDEYFGAQQIYRDRFYVSIPYRVSGNKPDSFELQVKSRGCADLGICFLPQTWVSEVALATGVAANNSDNAFGLQSGSSGMGEFLPVDEAFRPYAEAVDGNTIEISFQIAADYYLYKDKISVGSSDTGVRFGRVNLPPGKQKSDEYFGDVEVFYDDVFGKVSLSRADLQAMTLQIDLSYQGCAEGGICYAPETRTLAVSLPLATEVATLPDAPADQGMVSEQDRLAGLIKTAPFWFVIATFFGAGLLLSFTPCVLPMVPILSGIIAGEAENATAVRGFFLALSYVMGMALVYTAMGIGAAAAGEGLGLQAAFNQPWVLISFAGLFVVLALGMFGMYDLQMPSSIQSRLANISGNQKSGTTVGAFVMGALSSLIVTACVAPALIAVLTVMAQSGDMLRGGGALFAMSLGMGAPLLLVGAAQGKLLPKAGPWMVAIKNAFGFMMLGLGIWFLSRILPGTVTLALWAVLIFMAGVQLGGLTTVHPDSSGAQKLGKGFGLLAVIYGAVLLVGSLAGSNSLLRPLEALNSGGPGIAAEHRGLEFRRIKSVEDLDQAVASASVSGKSAMLDFYADWCVACLEMEERTFTDAGVQAALSNTVLLQADVTLNDEADQALLKRFGVFGPPTIIFFGADGKQRNGYEIVGFLKAADFAEHVKRATASNDTMTARSNESD